LANLHPTIRPFAPDEVPRPLAALAWDYPAGAHVPLHRHRKSQLVYARSGVMTVGTADGSWVVPPQRAVWVPGGTDHRIRMAGAVRMRTLYLDRGAARGMPAHCCVVAVSPLLRELILRAMELEPLYPERGAEQRLVDVLLDEIGSTPIAPLHLPLPSEPRLRVVVDGLLADPTDARSLAAWARTAGASARTLARLFEREAGMSFGAWRRQARLLRSLELLGSGESVTSVALALGYAGPSAFISMFRRNLGTTPARYFEETRPPPGAAGQGADSRVGRRAARPREGNPRGSRAIRPG
jgi:AraC-like DNA-binding protein/mannose-6-phosphate isomerase-like protein (cupin superfamily)